MKHTQVTESFAMLPRPWLISICGLMGSGKTTLARGLARAYNWSFVPESLPATKYLIDLFSNTSRWAFETQAAFLIYKTIHIQETIQAGRDLVLDRSLSEDINIFARHFHERGDIDYRSYQTYLALAQHLTSSLPTPDLAILCECPLEITKKRIISRDRHFQKLYPPGHLEHLEALYRDWKEQFDESDIYSLDTSLFDTRNPAIAETVAREIALILNAREGQAEQLILFDDRTAEQLVLFEGRPQGTTGPELLKPVKLQRSRSNTERRTVRIAAPTLRALEFPSAYIAAPFSDRTAPMDPVPGLLFQPSSAHGVIRLSQYRRMLTGLDKELRKVGITGFLPHRDINKWGKRHLTPEQVTELCTDHVKEADLILAIPGLSHGTHYELGLALGLGKPSIVIHCEEIQSSFISTGFTSKRNKLLVAHCKRLSQVPTLMRSSEVRAFLSRHVPLSGETASKCVD